MSDESNTRLVRLESFVDRYLAALIALPMPMTSFCLMGMLAGMFVAGFFVRGWFS